MEKKLGATETDESHGLVEQNEEDAKVSLHLDTCKAWLDAYFNGTLLEMNPSPQKPPLVLPRKGVYFCFIVADFDPLPRFAGWAKEYHAKL